MEISLINALFALFVALSVGDIISTRRALDAGKREANPVMRWIFERFDATAALIVTKALAVSAVWATMSPDSTWVLVVIDAFYAWVVWHNTRLVRAG